MPTRYQLRPWIVLLLVATLVASIGLGAQKLGLVGGVIPQAGEGFPELPDDAETERILPRVEVTTTGPHDFIQRLPDGSPVAFDPCRPVHYVINPENASPEGVELAHEAIARVSEATGLAFTDDGLTDERPPTGGAREPVQQRYGDRWAPVLIAWSEGGVDPELTNDTAGYANNFPVTPNGPGTTRLVTGMVVLDTDQLSQAATFEWGRDLDRAIIMHELAHVVGLAHVDDRGQLMAPAAGTITTFQAGDLAGLAQAGAGQCFTDT